MTVIFIHSILTTPFQNPVSALAANNTFKQGSSLLMMGKNNTLSGNQTPTHHHHPGFGLYYCHHCR